MEDPFVSKRAFTNIKELRSEIDIRLTMVLIAFLLLNVLKTALFGLFITSPVSYLGSFLHSFFMLLAVTLTLLIIVLKIRSRSIIIAIYTIQLIYMLANLSYYMYFHNYLHLFQSSVLFTEGLGAVGHFAVPKKPKLLILFIDLPFFTYLIYSYNKVYALNLRLKTVKKFFISLCITFMFLLEGWNFIHDFSFIHILKDYPSNEALLVERYGTLLNSTVDAWKNRNDLKLIGDLTYGKEVHSSLTSGNRPNFIIIQVESMDSNIINKKYNDKYIMPYMASLSKKSVYYPYSLSYHKAGGTSDCEFSIFESIEPLDNFPSMKINSYTYPNSFVKILAYNSYYTAAFHGNIASYFSRDKAYPQIGFMDFHDMTRMGLRNIGWGAPDMDVFKYVIRQLKEQTSPFLYHVITMTSHGPFTNARNYYTNKDYSDIKDNIVRDYFNSMSYVDKSLGYFIDYIKQHLENTYVIILGDHTPSINTDTFKQASLQMENSYFEFVPIIILTPDKQVHREEHISASFLDIAPTILNSSGISFSYKSNGVNLLSNETTGSIPYKGNTYDRAALFSLTSLFR